MPTVRDVLNEIKWRHGALDAVEVTYVHRGAPDGVRVVGGREIVALHHSFLELAGPRGGAMIPYHRVVRVERDGAVAWERRPSGAAHDAE